MSSTLSTIPGADDAVSGGRPPVPLTPLIGREQELATLRHLLCDAGTRLLTLTGPGGTGKTRLAQQLALDLSDEFSNGSRFISLATLRGAGQVPQAIALGLGLREVGDVALSDVIARYLSERELLLVLDNFEQLVDAAPLVSDLLGRCPGLVIVVTSRRPLHIRGEQEFPVPPLALPGAHRSRPVEELTGYAAVALFVERARAVDPAFVLDEHTAPVVADICLRLDGLPLAIELGAARMKVLTPEDLLARLASRLRVLIGGARDLPARQRTLRDTIAWSYELLSPDEQALIRRLSVFVGGFTLAASAAVASDEVDVLDGIASLVDTNLVRRITRPDTSARFSMLETIREYGLEQLNAYDELTATRDRHARYVADLVRDVERDLLLGIAQDRRFTELDWEIDNLRAALAWLFAGSDVEAGLRLVSTLWPFWELRSHWVEGRGWLERAVGMADAVAPGLRVRLLLGSGIFALYQGEYALAGHRLEESLTIARRLGDQTLAAISIFALANLAIESPDPDYALGLSRFETAMTTFRSLDHHFWVGRTANNLGNIAMAQGDGARAAAHFSEALALARELGTTWGIAGSLGNLARALLLQGELARAEDIMHESLAVSRELGSGHVQSNALETAARIARARGRPEYAARLWGASEVVRAELGKARAAPDRAARAESIDAARRALGDAAFDAAWTNGRAAALAGNLEELLNDVQVPAPPGRSTPVERRPQVSIVNLSPREHEVLTLLVAGDSDRQIADKLFISRRTAQGHVANIFNKLGVSSRTAAATTAISLGIISPPHSAR